MTPLITCICPTANRRSFVAEAIKLFLAQDYPQDRCHLLIVEDGSDNCADLVREANRSAERVFHAHLGYTKRSIGAKRNAACSAAAGDLIAHWDDDDWHSPTRLSTQVTALIEARGRVLPRRILIDLALGPDADAADRTIDTHVFTLRKKLGTCADAVETIRGAGYRVRNG